MGEKTKALQSFLTDDQILEVLTMFDSGSKLDACKLLQEYTFTQWQLSTIEAMKIIQSIHKEWNNN